MAAPAPAWNLIRCYGTWNNLDGTKKAGAYRVSIPQRVSDATDDVIIPAGIFLNGSLNTGAGPSLDILIPAVDDPDISPQNWAVNVTVNFNDGSAPETFNLQPSVSGGAVNLRTIVLPSNAPPLTELLFRGVPGGLAELDADGDVTNAAGAKILGGGGGTGTGTVTTSGITDATTLGRNLIKAVDGPAARTLIGAGTSNLILGSTGTTAKPGSYQPVLSDLGITGSPSTNTWLRGDGTWTALPSTTTLIETVNTVAVSGSALTLPAVTAATIHDVTLTANCTITLPTVTAGASFTVRLNQDSVGSRTVAWPASSRWAGGVRPTLSTGAGKQDIVTFTGIGTSWLGFLAGLDMR